MRSLPQISRGLSPREPGRSVAGENPETGIGGRGLACLDPRLHGPHSWFTILFYVVVNEHLKGHPILSSVFIQITLWGFFFYILCTNSRSGERRKQELNHKYSLGSRNVLASHGLKVEKHSCVSELRGAGGPRSREP